MTEMYKRIDDLCKERKITVSDMCRDLEIRRSVLSELSSGRSKSLSAANTAKISNYFGVSTDYLLGNVSEPYFYLDNERIKQDLNSYGNEKTPALTKKDERDIYKKWRADLEELENSQDGLMFDGQPLDDETKELLAISLKNSLELSKKIAKQKYTPKKYRKQDKPEGD